MEFKHAYFNIKGVDYFDYTLYANGKMHHTRWREDDFDPNEKFGDDYFVADEAIVGKLEKLKDFTDATIKPPKKSNIYITPNMPYPIEDIRNNYNIKRVPDSGAYNVFCPIKISCNNPYLYGYTIAIFPSLKAAYVRKAHDGEKRPEVIYKEACVFIPNADYGEMILDIHDFWTRYQVVAKQSAYKALLDKTLTKPCVPWTNLDISGQNQLTNDILTLVKKTGEVYYNNKDAEKNFVMQLNVLNQHNWRDYPGTIAMLFLELLWKDRGSIYFEVRQHSSKYSKAVKQLLFHRDGVKFKDEKDLNFARNYIDSLLDVGQCRYVSVSNLQCKLAEINLSQKTFEKLYNTIVRITPKEFKEKSEEDN